MLIKIFFYSNWFFLLLAKMCGSTIILQILLQKLERKSHGVAVADIKVCNYYVYYKYIRNMKKKSFKRNLEMTCEIA